MAFELLGATCIDQTNNFDQTLNIWRHVADLRDLNFCFISKYEAVEKKLNIIEGLTRDEIYVRALKVRECYLGQLHKDTLQSIIKRGKVYMEESHQYERGFNMFRYAINLYVDVLSDGECRVTYLIVIFFNRHFSFMVKQKSGRKFLVARFDVLLTALDLVIKEVQFNKRGLCSIMIEIILTFLDILARLSRFNTTENVLKLKRLTYKLIKLPNMKKSTWLHYTCSKYSLVDLYVSDSWRQYISIELVKLLIDCGSDINALDFNHRTPLHVASKNVPDCVKRGDKYPEVIELLLKHGGHYDARDDKGETFRFYKEEESFHYSSLKCLASIVIKKISINYDENIPNSLNTFVEIH